MSLLNTLALIAAPTDNDREMVINKMINDAGGSGVMDRDAERERMATEYYESQAASQPESVGKYENRRGE